MEKFKTIIEKSVSAEIVEKKSKFIANLFFVDSAEEAENKIKELEASKTVAPSDKPDNNDDDFHVL